MSKDETALAQALEPGLLARGVRPAPAAHRPRRPHADASTPSGFTGNTGSGNAGSRRRQRLEHQHATGTDPARVAATGSGSEPPPTHPSRSPSDQAAIDTAEADLTDAEQSLNEATLTSPISGTVVSVGIDVGDTVSADSSTEVIVIIGTKSYEVAGTLSSSQVPSVKVGDSAGVQVDGVDGTIDGTVSQVGPVQSSESGYTLPGGGRAARVRPRGLFTGSTANVVIATGAVSNVVAVPTSAVQTLGSRSYRRELDKGILTRKVIKVGMVGDTYTQVLSGLSSRTERRAGRLRRGGPVVQHQHHRAVWAAASAGAAVSGAEASVGPGRSASSAAAAVRPAPASAAEAVRASADTGGAPVDDRAVLANNAEAALRAPRPRSASNRS